MPGILGIAEAGIRNGLRQLDAVSNNMANVNTQGYKREVYLNRSFSQYLPGSTGIAGGQPTAPSTSVRDFAPGPLKYTGSTLNLAIEGKGFFQLQSPQGVVLTRDGQFQINQQGQLVSSQGWPVLLKGTANFDDPNFKVQSDGTVVVGGEQLTQLDLTNPDAQTLEVVGSGLFRTTAAGVASSEGVSVRQGYLEGSNVDSLSEMVKLMGVTRHVEAQQQMIRAYDEMLDSAITNLGQF